MNVTPPKSDYHRSVRSIGWADVLAAGLLVVAIIATVAGVWRYRENSTRNIYGRNFTPEYAFELLTPSKLASPLPDSWDECELRTYEKVSEYSHRLWLLENSLRREYSFLVPANPGIADLNLNDALAMRTESWHADQLLKRSDIAWFYQPIALPDCPVYQPSNIENISDALPIRLALLAHDFDAAVTATANQIRIVAAAGLSNYRLFVGHDLRKAYTNASQVCQLASLNESQLEELATTAERPDYAAAWQRLLGNAIEILPQAIDKELQSNTSDLVRSKLVVLQNDFATLEEMSFRQADSIIDQYLPPSLMEVKQSSDEPSSSLQMLSNQLDMKLDFLARTEFARQTLLLLIDLRQHFVEHGEWPEYSQTEFRQLCEERFGDAAIFVNLLDPLYRRVGKDIEVRVSAGEQPLRLRHSP